MTTMLKAHSSSSSSSLASTSSRLHPEDRMHSAHPHSHAHSGRARKHSSASSRSYSPYPLTPPQSIREAHSPQHVPQRWDDDMPNAPAPLSDILRAFKESGDGDREMLLAILNAKRAEEERITTLMQTRLALLHAHVQGQQSSPQSPRPSILHSPYPGQGTGAQPISIPRSPREFGSGSSTGSGAHGLELLLNAGRVRESDERSR